MSEKEKPSVSARVAKLLTEVGETDVDEYGSVLYAVAELEREVAVMKSYHVAEIKMELERFRQKIRES